MNKTVVHEQKSVKMKRQITNSPMPEPCRHLTAQEDVWNLHCWLGYPEVERSQMEKLIHRKPLVQFLQLPNKQAKKFRTSAHFD